ncbi:MAG: hypothetical protein JWP86_2977 [Phenylobacterium sp.]|nr:hypothetical protein [Phenylobacterium sp.]
MAELTPKTAIRPFNPSGYEILDANLAANGEVVIWSVSPLKPRIGDLLLIESGGRLYDVAVEALAAVDGGWSAKARQTRP